MLFQPRGSVAATTAPAVVNLRLRHGEGSIDHTAEGFRGLAKRLAGILGCGFADAPCGRDAERAANSGHYFVPDITLVGRHPAASLGIRGETDLFGGVVPAGFVGTKAITHRLPRPGAPAPLEWSPRFAEGVASVVLDGFTAFTLEEARRAGTALLRRDKVRVKPANADGGRGQSVVADVQALNAALERLGSDDLARFGVVLEQNLADPVTYSIGRVTVGGCTFSYWGTQRTTRTGTGKSAYGGTRLRARRGGFDAVLAQAVLPAGARQAIECARLYDALADQCFAGIVASRRNYDVVEGVDANGHLRTGVLEQSWRIGGASGAEIAALEALRADADLAGVEAACVEAYGNRIDQPDNAWTYFDGHDDQGEPLRKFAWVEGPL